VRQVQVPFTREIHTPVMRKQLVPSVVERKVPVTRQVVRQGWEWVDEEYTEIVEGAKNVDFISANLKHWFFLSSSSTS
jgi:hypothetical protein